MDLSKKTKLLIGLCIIALILLSKIFYIQIIDERYKIDATNNSMVYSIVYPTRGIIHDRNEEILVENKIAYDFMVTPREVTEFDTLALAKILEVDPQLIIDQMAEYRKFRTRIGFRTLVMFKKIQASTYLKFAEVSYKFPGFKGQMRSIREYPYKAGGNLFGYVSEVDANYIKKHPGEYKSGDYAGKTGLEAAMEKELRGEKGYNIYLRNSHNKIESRYKDGTFDKIAIPGNDITTTIDAKLQMYGQELMANKVGSLVAIEPSTGEILTLVSSPGIDVEMLSDIGNHYKEIVNDPYKPMFNRAVQAPYPPGSTFKMVTGLIGLQEGVFTPETHFTCNNGYHFGRNKLGCHSHKPSINLTESLMMSCNAYYCHVFRRIIENNKYKTQAEALDMWSKYVKSFGFGTKLGSDFPSELGGFVPTANYYNKIYGNNRWKATTIISLSIGQGELGCTPLHLANLAATIANRGFYYIPHMMKQNKYVQIGEKYKTKQYTLIDTTHFPKVIEGMYLAVNGGYQSGATASIASVPGLEICGKTGTAQNPRGDDHSTFICFAPKDNPKIAVVAYIENGSFGGRWAAPIASLLVEKYLSGEISEARKPLEKRMLEGNLMDKVKKN